MRSTALPLLILVAISLIPTEVGADSITYNVVNYPELQTGYTVTGTITTNGTIGTALPTTDITSWDITITQATTTLETYNPTTSQLIPGFFNATTTEITVTLGSETQGSEIEFLIQDLPTNTSIAWLAFPQATEYRSEIEDAVLWSTTRFDPASQPVATIVPEPSSAVLAVIGAGSVVACGLVRQRRAKRRQTDVGHTQPTE